MGWRPNTIAISYTYVRPGKNELGVNISIDKEDFHILYQLQRNPHKAILYLNHEGFGGLCKLLINECRITEIIKNDEGFE